LDALQNIIIESNPNDDLAHLRDYSQGGALFESWTHWAVPPT